MRQDEKLAEILAPIPPLDKDGTLTGPAWEDAIKVFDAVLEGGKDRVAALAGMVQEPDDGRDYKARYALHGLAQYLGRPGKEAPRAVYCEALAGQLGGEIAKGAKGFLARQLQVIGGRECAAALGKLLGDAELHEYAAQALLAIRAGAAEEFRRALPGLKGAARLTAVQALGVLRDAESVEALRQAAGEEDADLRVVAAWALANIGDAASVDAVLRAGDAEPGWARIKATSACLLLGERLAAAGKKPEAARVYRHLKETRKDDSEGYVRALAEEALAALGG